MFMLVFNVVPNGQGSNNTSRQVSPDLFEGFFNELMEFLWSTWEKWGNWVLGRTICQAAFMVNLYAHIFVMVTYWI